jgi:hypothetical protein
VAPGGGTAAGERLAFGAGELHTPADGGSGGGLGGRPDGGLVGPAGDPEPGDPDAPDGGDDPAGGEGLGGAGLGDEGAMLDAPLVSSAFELNLDDGLADRLDSGALDGLVD